MKYLKYILVAVSFCFVLNTQADEILDNYKKISDVIERVQSGEKKALDDLMAIALGEHPLELSDKIKAAVVYGLTTSNDSQKLADFLNKTGIEKSDVFSDKKFHTDCKACEGEGHTSKDCKSCVFGKCKNCKGQGVIEYDGLSGEKVKSICTKCQGTKKCVKCEGSGDMEKDCSTCIKGDVFDRSSVFKEYVNSVKDIDQMISQKIAQMEKVDTQVDSNVKTDSEVSKTMNLEEDINIKETKNENNEQPTEVKEEIEEDKEELIAEIADPRLESSFNEVKKLILNHENKHNQKIFNEIKFILDDKTPTMVLNFNESFYKNIGDTEKSVIHNFEKFWEARAFLNGYKGKVEIKLLNNEKNVNELLNSN